MLPLGFLGAGNMAEAIVRALLTSRSARASDLHAADPAPARRELFASLGVAVATENAAVARACRTLVLSCKPQQMKDVLEGIAGAISPEALVVSIAAGVSTEQIRGYLHRPAQRVVRVMPNTPLMANAGMSALAPAPGVGDEDVAVVRRIFESAGRVVVVREDQMDAVTAVSGSGPAYYFLLTEHLARAGIELGLEPETAELLARQTALGAATMMSLSTESTPDLRRKVTSPGGTTQAAVEHMEKHDLPATFRAAVAAAARRGRELREGVK